jgi:hypothetical protein
MKTALMTMLATIKAIAFFAMPAAITNRIEIIGVIIA